jgi:response regulator of citrate/malate metabolism
MTVLFVDDDIDDREFFIDALSYVNASVHCELASNCEHAMSILKKSNDLPEYIFLDINMPVTDGKDCLTKLKKHETYKNIKIVMYSTASDQRLIEEYKRLGATYFLVKPSTFNGLCDSLSILFGK